MEAIPLSLGNSTPTPGHEMMDSSELGSNLEDAVRVLGPWDKVGDVMSDTKGQFYPFSNRDGYDYIVRVGVNSSINGVWRRQRNDSRIEQSNADKPATAVDSETEQKKRVNPKSKASSP
jgi:hypothetical protein